VPARRFQRFSFGAVGEPGEARIWRLCVRCARAERQRRMRESPPAEGVTRGELIAELERFFAGSGVLEICRRCHEQGTGCCPQACRALQPTGCGGKNLFCAAFVCGALLNAIAECDRRAARLLKWAKRQLGPAEFRIYEMMTRVPAEYREEERPLVLPRRYPGPLGLGDGRDIVPQLLALADEVLTVRRRWSVQPDEPRAAASQALAEELVRS
jgi:hypothetical protein